MRDGIGRWSSIAVGAGTVVLAGYLAIESTDIRPRHASASTDGGATVAANTSASAAPTSSSTSAASIDLDASLPALDLDAGLPSSFSLNLDAAALPTGGPRTVKVGVVLVSWQGAENAGTNTRPKSEALVKAQELASIAKTDFRRAVTQGDPGSSEDIGRIPRGTLDPRTESVLFMLPSGEVSDVIETARGYWIVKRLD